MTLGFKVAGSKYRIPQSEIWDINGTSSVGVDAATEETMHSTVRYLRENTLVKPFYCADAAYLNSANLWQWRLSCRARTWVDRFRRKTNQPALETNIIDEKQMDDFERKSLKAWITHDHYNFDEQVHEAGQHAPNAILVQLRHWLDSP